MTLASEALERLAAYEQDCPGAAECGYWSRDDKGAVEFYCPTCGEPVQRGDRAYQDGRDGPCYCSAYCAGADPARQRIEGGEGGAA